MAEREETRFSGNLSFPTYHGHERWHWLSREGSAASLMQVFDVSLPWIRADDACLVHTNPIPHHEHCFLSFFSFYFTFIMFGQLSCHSARLPSLFADCYLELCCLWSPDWRPHKPSCKVMLSVVILRLFLTSCTLMQFFCHLNRLQA